MDKAPDAFRTISEVADDLDIPQHVLRFWETRFSQIKPMKRSGGRRFYRPDDVALLHGIRRLLYGEGYTIRGVQRILKEQGIKAVQRLSDAAMPVPSLYTLDDGVARPIRGDTDTSSADTALAQAEMPLEESASDDEMPIEDDTEAPPVAPSHTTPPRRMMATPLPRSDAIPAPRIDPAPAFAAALPPRRPDLSKLNAVLQDLTACRQLLDAAMKDG